MAATWGSSAVKWGDRYTSWSGTVLPDYKPYRYQVWSTESYVVSSGQAWATADPTRRPTVSRVESGESGYWAVYAYLPNGTKIDVTKVRGVPTAVSAVTTTDPFGPAAATLVFPAITALDNVGTGDLEWLTEEYDVDIVWVNADPAWGTVGAARYTWEGYFASYDYSTDETGSQLTVACRGALFQMDNYLAKPEFTSRPIPYEYAIRRQFLEPSGGYVSIRPDSRFDLSDIEVADLPGMFPTGWTRTYSAANYDSTNAPWTVPLYVQDGAKWTGLLTRETGNWEQTLTGYISGLLTNMQFSSTTASGSSSGLADGQVTLMLNTGRKPALKFRPFITSPSQTPLVGDSVLKVDLTWPGVTISATEDFSQRAAVVYSQGTATDGEVYSGMQVSYDGSLTTYDPAAWDATVHPTAGNGSLNPDRMRKEVKVDFGEGLTPKQSAYAAKAYLNRFATPGITGTLTLDTDPLTQAGRPYPRQIIQAGSVIEVAGLFGQSSTLVHVTEANSSVEGTVTCTFDTKYRDQMTVDQVRLRGRDSLIPFRSISTSGTYSPKVQDLLYPWSYTTGSGVVPEWRTDVNDGTDLSLFQRGRNALAANPGLYTGNPDQVPFPWTEYTTLLPPSTWGRFYVRVPPAWYSINSITVASNVATVSLSSSHGIQSPVSANINSITKTGTVSLVVTNTEHHLMTGDQVVIAGNAAANNGTWTVLARKSPTRFTFTGGATNATAAGTASTVAASIKVSGSPSSALNNGTTPWTVASAPSSTTLTFATSGIANGTYTGGKLSLANANYNWAQQNYNPALTRQRNIEAFAGGNGYRVKLAAKGEIRLVQIAAYDSAGNIKPVSFHVSLYAYSGVTWQKMPMIPYMAKMPAGVMSTHAYAVGQHYPFFGEAWEKINPTGTVPTNTDQLVAADGGSFLAGWGTYYERAGHWPGSSANSDPATGMLQDEVGFSWDFTNDPARIDPQKSYAQQTAVNSVWAWLMIYCDDSDTDTYFLGRMWQKPYSS